LFAWKLYLVEEVVVDGGNDATANDTHTVISASLLLQFLDERRHKGLVPSGLARDSNHMHVGVDSLRAGGA
jgi:hypothetical protein